MKHINLFLAALLVILLAAFSYFFLRDNTETSTPAPEPTEEEMLPVEPDGGIGDGAEPLEPTPDQAVRDGESILGTSVNGTPIVAHHFGDGNTELLLVGGVHGGYSPNTSALANEFVTYFETNPDVIPENVMVTIIPTLNPDGANLSGAGGRFNANDVDLNRNFDCEWAATGMWREQEVSGGSAPFSEPEAAALRDYVTTYDPTAAIVWFSAEGVVYPAACETEPSTAAIALANTFANAASYSVELEFDAYRITGDMVNWMAAQDITAISVLLSDHESSEWEENLAGLTAVLNAYAD